MAASVAIVSWGGFYFLKNPELKPTGAVALAGLEAVEDVTGGGEELGAGGCTQNVVIRDQVSLALFSRVTKTAMLSSLELPARLAPSLQLTLCTGTAWMQQASGTQERGYIVAVPPSCTLNVYVDADAAGDNSLVIVEIGPSGASTGEAISFSNRRETESDASPSELGCIGTYTKYNATSVTKHYLFTGSHVRPNQTKDDSRLLSDYSVLLDTPGLLYIGWDDSGYRVDEPDAPSFYRADRDFDDISATIRVLEPTGDSTVAVSSGVRLTPEPASDGTVVEDAESGFTVSVAPGEQMVLRVTAESKMPNAISIVDAATQKLLWRQDRLWEQFVDSPEEERRAYLIDNQSAEVKNYLLIAHHAPAGYRVTAKNLQPRRSRLAPDPSPSDQQR